MVSTPVPRVAFLGVCDRFSKARNVDPNLSSINLIALRREVVSSIYPLPLRSLLLVFAIYNATNMPGVEIVGIGQKNKQSFFIKIDFKLYPEGQIPVDPMAPQELLVSSDSSWTILVVRFPEPMRMAVSPDRFELFMKEDSEQIPIGALDLLFAPAPPLTEDRIAAIRSDPRAAKFVRMEIGCTSCDSKLKAYAGLEKSEGLQGEGALWYRDLPERFLCACGNTNVDLSILRDNLHVALGERIYATEDEISITRLYEVGTLVAIADRFRRLLDRNPEEPDAQAFLEETPLLFHRFSPARIIKKPPILNRYAADFAILSRSGELYLIEIEKPGKKIIKKNGGRTAAFNHAFDQVRDWLHLIDEHRVTCLEMMNLKHDHVASIRGVVIIGRDADCAPDQLRKLKGMDFGPIDFFTFDDLAEGLEALITELKGL